MRFDVEMEDSLITTLVKIFDAFSHAKSNILKPLPAKTGGFAMF
jgi:hypothetical protein